ncbi:MAG: biopolymer transporter ExbD [Gammaproteobacteria bacterium]|nr:biopolymer transporter ExbD [Gammaproteobacteria bacterium]MDH3767804.1 biopolymer transporter ExbD [Gammaproteobacteria bacterium]
MNLRARLPEEPEINLTSLIDVVLLLLVFFMVSTSFTRESELKIELPQTAEAAAPEQAVDEPMEITVTSQGGYLLQHRELINNQPATLRRAIIRLYGDDRDRPVTIRADARASHQAVVTAMDVVGRLGFVRINIATVNEGPAN